jgi:hypothetical protein
MEDLTADSRELKEQPNSIPRQVEMGRGNEQVDRPVARVLSASPPRDLPVLIADGSVRPPHGPRYIPTKPAKPRKLGKDAAEYVLEGGR